MRVYQVQFDGDYRVVEAANFRAAIVVWRKGLMADDEDLDEAELEPESVTCISEEPVLQHPSVYFAAVKARDGLRRLLDGVYAPQMTGRLELAALLESLDLALEQRT